MRRNVLYHERGGVLQEYEEILVPASKPPAFKEGERLIKISELPEWMHPAFEGMKELNRIQSRVSQTALYTSENILMCAPTGAGKTNVAMLTILQEVRPTPFKPQMLLSSCHLACACHIARWMNDK